jgi:hypothetical protein
MILSILEWPEGYNLNEDIRTCYVQSSEDEQGNKTIELIDITQEFDQLKKDNGKLCDVMERNKLLEHVTTHLKEENRYIVKTIQRLLGLQGDT